MSYHDKQAFCPYFPSRRSVIIFKGLLLLLRFES
jgi:hypothetical protein